MKTLRDIKIGDTLFCIDISQNFVAENYSGCTYPSKLITDIEVKKIELDEGFFYFNGSDYNRRYYLKVELDKIDAELYIDKGKYYFADTERKDEFVRTIVVEKINSIQKQIKANRLSNEKVIEEIRKTYYHILK